MIVNSQVILKPNSEYERIEELSRLFEMELGETDKQILNECTTEDHESIGMIGCLLNDKSRMNTVRLLIATRNKSNPKLANTAHKLLELENEEELIESLSEVFILDSDTLSEYEDRLLFILFGILKQERDVNSL